MVPGICNTGDTDYIHEFSCYMNRDGYDVAVLNHVGALKNVKITYPRIFSYGMLFINSLYNMENTMKFVFNLNFYIKRYALDSQK